MKTASGVIGVGSSHLEKLTQIYGSKSKASAGVKKDNLISSDPFTSQYPKTNLTIDKNRPGSVATG